MSLQFCQTSWRHITDDGNLQEIFQVRSSVLFSVTRQLLNGNWFCIRRHVCWWHIHGIYTVSHFVSCMLATILRIWRQSPPSLTWRGAMSQRSGVQSNRLLNGKGQLGIYAVQRRAIVISVFYSPTIGKTVRVTDKHKWFNITQDTFQCNSDGKDWIHFYKYKLNTFKVFVKEKTTPVLVRQQS